MTPTFAKSVERTPREATESASPTSDLEKRGVLVFFCLYLAIQVNAAFHHGSWGQDFVLHKLWIRLALAHPWQYATELEVHRTNPPLYELFCALIFKLTNGVYSLEVIALLSVALNTAGLVLLYKLIRAFVKDPLVRLSCLIFILFLPFAMITELVLATDALALPIFFCLLFLLNKLAAQRDGRAFWKTLTGVIVVLLLGMATKLTFGVEICASIAAIWMMERAAVMRRDRAAIASIVILFATGVPIATARLLTKGSYNLLLGTLPGSEMTIRDIIFFRSLDWKLLRAPSYDAKSSTPSPKIGAWPAHNYELLAKDKYSYPGLLELAIFTDVMNIYQDLRYDPKEIDFGSRSERNQKRMQLAVRTGLLFFFGVVIMSPLVIVEAFWNALIRRRAAAVGPAIVALCSLAWYLNILLGFLVVPAYYGGYWLPRLAAPALLSFALLAAVGIDHFIRFRSRAWAISLLVLVILQSAVQVSFLWPWGGTRGY